MPYINDKTGGPLAREQNEAIGKGFCEVLENIAGKKKNTVYTVFDEVKRENWAVGDELLG